MTRSVIFRLEDLQGVASRYLLDLVAVDLARRHMTGLIFSFI